MLIVIIVSECKRKYEIVGSGQVISALCSLEDVPIYLDRVSRSAPSDLSSGMIYESSLL